LHVKILRVLESVPLEEAGMSKKRYRPEEIVSKLRQGASGVAGTFLH
jgi:hypothetical protein